jgi:K+-transporting ATPase KdpF subunit
VPHRIIFVIQGEPHGLSRACHRWLVFSHLLGAADPLPKPDGVKMTFFYGLAGLITLALLIYLVFALLKPEWFE